MSKISKRVFSYLITFVLVIGCWFMVVGCSCGKDDSSKIMNLSLNPSIELVLDKENKVVSANALNDEGNYIVANFDFTGLNAEETVEVFLQAAKDNGFVIGGNVSTSENQLKISISGENAQKLFDSVKKSANKYLSEANLNVNISLDKKLTKEYLENLVADCMQELTEEEIELMSEEELITLIKTSREETKTLLSQELKDLYYQLRAEEILKAKFDEISRLLANNSIIGSTIKPTFDAAFNTFKSKIDEFRTAYIEKYLSETSDYRAKMQEYIEAKNALLEARVNGGVTEQDLVNINTDLENAKAALGSAKATTDQVLTAVNTAIEGSLTSLRTILDTLSSYLDLDAINTAMFTAKNNFNENFKNTYQSYISDNYWNDLKPLKTN